MNSDLQIDIDRTAKVSLTEQIRLSISRAIEAGVLAPGARLPSWQALAAQLGIARSTVKRAYDLLSDSQMIEAFGAKGSRVAARPRAPVSKLELPMLSPFMKTYQEMTAGPAIFQLGVPALEPAPHNFFARARSSNLLKTEHSASLIYPDPTGEFALRQEIANYLSIARKLHCDPEQVFITSGYMAGLGVTLRVLGMEGKKVWMEDPGFQFARKGLELACLNIVDVPVDAEGINVDYGIEHAADAALVVVTPGQHAPLGTTLSFRRRLQLLEWATSTGAWIIEDDYLSELQLDGKPAPALASLDKGDRVIHIGSFSKTISPALRLGFIVAPPELANTFAEVTATLAPAPPPIIQLATARFMRDGHYTQRVRRLRRLYCAQRNALCKQLREHDAQWANAGLSVLLRLPPNAPDVLIAREAMTVGMAPLPFSRTFATPSWVLPGLFLGVATAPERHMVTSCRRLFEIIDRYC